jgi:hypothetical protein
VGHALSAGPAIELPGTLDAGVAAAARVDNAALFACSAGLGFRPCVLHAVVNVNAASRMSNPEEIDDDLVKADSVPMSYARMSELM